MAVGNALVSELTGCQDPVGARVVVTEAQCITRCEASNFWLKRELCCALLQCCELAEKLAEDMEIEDLRGKTLTLKLKPPNFEVFALLSALYSLHQDSRSVSVVSFGSGPSQSCSVATLHASRVCKPSHRAHLHSWLSSQHLSLYHTRPLNSTCQSTVGAWLDARSYLVFIIDMPSMV